MKYKILDVISRESNKTVDKFGVVGFEVTSVYPSQTDRSAVLRLPDGMNLRTSTVEEITEDGDMVRVTTLNTIYVMRVINVESEDAK